MLLTKRDIRRIIVALKAQQDAAETAWRTSDNKQYLAGMQELQELRLDIQRQTKKRAL